MSTHCEICGRQFYGIQYSSGVLPIANYRFCVECATRACETLEALLAIKPHMTATLQVIEVHLEHEQRHCEGVRRQEVEHVLEVVRTQLSEYESLKGNAP